MDIFSHALWSNIGTQYVNLKFKRKLGNIQVVFWGIFPDIFSFTIPFVWLLKNLILTNFNIYSLNLDVFEPPSRIMISILTNLLYSLSHSLVIFSTVFVIIRIIKKRWYLEQLGWLLHIVLDIPTHSYKFYPTPFLWPLSDFRFDGISWAQPWFIILNYSFIILISIYLKKLKTQLPKYESP